MQRAGAGTEEVANSSHLFLFCPTAGGGWTGRDGLGVLTGQRSERAACGGMGRRSTGRRHGFITGVGVGGGRQDDDGSREGQVGIREKANTTDGRG